MLLPCQLEIQKLFRNYKRIVILYPRRIGKTFLLKETDKIGIKGGSIMEKETNYHWESQLRTWLKEICPWDQDENYVQYHGRLPLGYEFAKEMYRVVVNSAWAKQTNKNTLKMLIFTKDYKYAIVANETYLGCTMSCRKPRAGEDWTRGNDLPDVKFSRETWEKIKNAIIRNELVKVVKIKEYIEDEETPDENIVAP